MCMPSRLTGRAATIALAVGIAASGAGAQTRYGFVVGSVRDSAGTPIPDVAIGVAGHITVRSDSAGAFRLPAARGSRHAVGFRRLGFEAREATADLRRDSVVTLAVVMTALPQDLPGMVIEAEAERMKALADFYARKKAGFGYFLTRDDFEARHPTNVSDMMRMVPGAQLLPVRGGGRAVVRFVRSMGGRDCPPQIYVDGIMVKGMEIDELVPQDIEAMEIYQGVSVIPPQFNNRWGTSSCGVVVVWTRVPGT